MIDMAQHWSQIKKMVEIGQKSSIYCSIASADAMGMPNVTPIGTVFLRDDMTGFFFDQYTSQLSQNIAHNPHICLMAVNSGKRFWFESFLRGRFASPPGVRLDGIVSARRLATATELAMIAKRVQPVRWTKGAQLLWSDFHEVRDIRFTACRPVQYPTMMAHVWDVS